MSYQPGQPGDHAAGRRFHIDLGESDPQLDQAIAELATPGVAIGYRRILPGDEDALLPEERASIPSPLAERRCASGAARIAARQILARFGYDRCPIPRGTAGEPIWPVGMIGSLSHDHEFAVAAIARTRDVSGIGIDIEPATPLPFDMIDFVLTPKGPSAFPEDRLAGRRLFAAKEAVFKAVFPMDRSFLEFQDIDVDLDRMSASVCTGRTLSIRIGCSSHIVALATLPLQK